MKAKSLGNIPQTKAASGWAETLLQAAIRRGRRGVGSGQRGQDLNLRPSGYELEVLKRLPSCNVRPAVGEASAHHQTPAPWPPSVVPKLRQSAEDPLPLSERTSNLDPERIRKKWKVVRKKWKVKTFLTNFIFVYQ